MKKLTLSTTAPHGSVVSYNVVLARDEDAWIIAEVPELPGCLSQGKTEAEALANIREAIAAWLWADRLKQGDPPVA